MILSQSNMSHKVILRGRTKLNPIGKPAGMTSEDFTLRCCACSSSKFYADGPFCGQVCGIRGMPTGMCDKIFASACVMKYLKAWSFMFRAMIFIFERGLGQVTRHYLYNLQQKLDQW